jgi:hypothetical protein
MKTPWELDDNTLGTKKSKISLSLPTLLKKHLFGFIGCMLHYFIG